MTIKEKTAAEKAEARAIRLAANRLRRNMKGPALNQALAALYKTDGGRTVKLRRKDILEIERRASEEPVVVIMTSGTKRPWKLYSLSTYESNRNHIANRHAKAKAIAKAAKAEPAKQAEAERELVAA